MSNTLTQYVGFNFDLDQPLTRKHIMTKHTEKTEQFNPAKHLRFTKEVFINEDRVVGERKRLQYRRPDYDYWYNLDTEETMVKISNLEYLTNYSGVEMKPGIKEEIQALKDERDEEDDD